MKKLYSILTFAWVAMMMVNCDSTFEVIDKVDGLVSVSINSVNKQKSFSVGELYKAELWVQRGGINNNSGKVKFILDEQLLDSVNNEDKTNFVLLPKECYELTQTEFNVDQNEAYGYITYDPEKIHKLAGYDNVKYALPFRLVSDEIAINPERNVAVLSFVVSEPIVEISNPGTFNVDLTQTSQMDLNIGVPFTNKWNIVCNIAKDQALIDKYNTANKVNFMMLPSEAYTAPEEIVLKEGVSQITASYKLKDNLLPGNYLLPLRIEDIKATLNGTPSNALVVDKESNTLFRIVKEGQKISKAGWEIIDCNSQAGINPATNLIDDNEETFWHCRMKSETGWVEPPFYTTIDMKKKIAIAQIDLVNRGQTGSANNIKWVEFYASNDNSNWEKIGASDFNDEFVRKTFRYYVKATTARYLKLVIPAGYGNACPPAAIRELTVYGQVAE